MAYKLKMCFFDVRDIFFLNDCSSSSRKYSIIQKNMIGTCIYQATGHIVVEQLKFYEFRMITQTLVEIIHNIFSEITD